MLEISIPFPLNVVHFKNTYVSSGMIMFDPTTRFALWSIGNISGASRHSLSCMLELDSESFFKSIDISVKFKIAGYSSTGISVENLALHGERYKPFKG